MPGSDDAGGGRESVAGGGHAGRLHHCCAMRAVNATVLKAIQAMEVKAAATVKRPSRLSRMSNT